LPSKPALFVAASGSALAPDPIPPVLEPGEQPFDGFHRYGMRVLGVVVSPYARPGAGTSVVHDHASVLAMIEHVWNLPALTFRDANAHPVVDFLDLGTLRWGTPTFPELPALPRPNLMPATLASERSGPGRIPPSLATGS
jgi:phospholipase C